MRTGFAGAAVLLAALPAWAQSPIAVTGPRTLTPAMVACTDLPVAAVPEPRLVVAGAHGTDTRYLLADGAQLVIHRTLNDGLAPGQRYAVRRLQGAPGAFPRASEGFGAVRTAGFVTVTAVDDLNALATIDYACAEILLGDYLEMYNEPALPTEAAALVAPDFSDRARILPGTDGRIMSGDGDTLSIDRGTVHGVAAGARFAIYRDPRNGLPLVHLGEALVLEPGELTSKAVVLEAADVVSTDDVAVPRRRP
jgi:hypothetical protein